MDSTFSSARYRSPVYLAAHRVPRSQGEALDLRGADVDVVGSVQVVPLLRSQEPVALREDLEHALGVQGDLGLHEVLLDDEDQILLAKLREVADVLALELCVVHRRLRDGEGRRPRLGVPVIAAWRGLRL
jgi:hypothetical protein